MDKNYIIELIQQNRLQEAIKAIEKASKGSHLHNQVIMLSSSYAEYTELNRSATEDFETLQLQRAKITNRLLSVLDEIPPEDLEKVTLPPPSQATSTPSRATHAVPQTTYAPPQADDSKLWGIDKKWLMFGGGALAVLLLLMFMPLGDDTQTDTGATNTVQTGAVTGRNVRFVQYKSNEGQGYHFVEDEYGKWTEKNANNGVIANFQEIKRDDNSVFLRDESREVGITLELDLKNKQVKYADDRGKAFVLFQILDYH